MAAVARSFPESRTGKRIAEIDEPCTCFVESSPLGGGQYDPRVLFFIINRSGLNQMETKSIVALLIEDNPDDALLIQRDLTNSPRVKYSVTHVDRLAKGLELLKSISFDVLLLDLGLPDGLMGINTFEKAYAHASHIPIIVLTGHDDDEFAIESVQKGAQDYLVKGQVTGAVLGRSIRYAIERKKLLTQLEHSAKEIKKLRGILPICANCKKIRDDKGYWTQVEIYITNHSETEFSHGICPDCAAKIYPTFYKKDDETS